MDCSSSKELLDREHISSPKQLTCHGNGLQLISSNMWNKIKDPHLILCLAAVPSHSTLLGYKRKMGNSSREDKSLPQSPLLRPLFHQQLPSSHPCQAPCCGTGCWRQLPVPQSDGEEGMVVAVAGASEGLERINTGWRHRNGFLCVTAASKAGSGQHHFYIILSVACQASFFKPLEIFPEQSHNCSPCVCTDLLAQRAVAFPQYFSPVTEEYAPLETEVFHSYAAFTFHS